MNHPYNKRKPVTRVVQSIVEVTEPDKVWEFDIKYVWIHGETRNAYLLAMIDCYSREVVGHYFGCHCTGNDVKETMMAALTEEVWRTSREYASEATTEHSSYAIPLRIFSQ